MLSASITATRSSPTKSRARPSASAIPPGALLVPVHELVAEQPPEILDVLAAGHEHELLDARLAQGLDRVHRPSGRSNTGRRCLFVMRVSGSRRDPVPPARTTPFIERAMV